MDINKARGIFKFLPVKDKSYKMIKALKDDNRLLREKLKHYELIAMTDELTGLYNRRFLSKLLHSSISHAIRHNEPLSFIMLDMDNFKRINDLCGHTAGDQLLVEVSAMIKSSIRESDTAFRYGGDEFLVICPNTDLNSCKVIAERILENINRFNNVNIGTDNEVTLSLGISSKFFDKDADIDKETTMVIENADSALFKAKSKGRNRIELFQFEEI